MIPSKFDYLRVGSVDAAVAALSEHGSDAKLLAGGHSLLPLMKLRLANPAVLVDVGRLDDLRYVREDGDQIAVGALSTFEDLQADTVLRAQAPLVAEVAGQIGDPQVRNRGTIGGTLAHGDPAGDMGATALATRATLVVQGPNGTREISADDFFEGFLETALADDELLTEIRVPKMGDAGWSFQKFSRRAQDFAIVGVALVSNNGSSGVGLVNMDSRSVRASGVEAALADGVSAADAAAVAAEGCEPPSDLNATPEYRSHLARVLVERALTDAQD